MAKKAGFDAKITVFHVGTLYAYYKPSKQTKGNEMKVSHASIQWHGETAEGYIAHRDNGIPCFIKSIKLGNESVSMADCSIELYNAIMDKAIENAERSITDRNNR